MSIIAEPRLPSSLGLIQVGARVQVIAEPGTYIVTYIDHRRHAVDLIPLNGGQTVRGIHVSAITIPTDHLVSMRTRSLFARLVGRNNGAA